MENDPKNKKIDMDEVRRIVKENQENTNTTEKHKPSEMIEYLDYAYRPIKKEDK